jgi:hypothetical protein
VSLQHLAWVVLSLWQISPGGWGPYALAVVVLAAGSEDPGDPIR